ncbi:MAG TPA: hypothetical protein VH741_00555 [Candidatus Limnocylindrales bacterium]
MAVVFDSDRHCGARRRSDDRNGDGVRGQPCRKPAGWGTDHNGIGRCKLHGGLGLGARQQAERIAIERRARVALQRLGQSIEIEPAEALLNLVGEAAANVAYLASEVGSLGSLTAIPQVMTRAGEVIDDGEYIRAIVRLYNEERDRLARTAKAALNAGVAERQVRLAEAHGRELVRIVVAVLGRLDLTQEQTVAARLMIAEEFRNLTAAPAPTTALLPPRSPFAAGRL